MNRRNPSRGGGAIAVWSDETGVRGRPSRRADAPSQDEDAFNPRTVITIAHRLSTIRNASRIVVLAQGRIIEEGDFRSLTARNGAFARMVAAQNTGDDYLHV